MKKTENLVRAIIIASIVVSAITFGIMLAAKAIGNVSVMNVSLIIGCVTGLMPLFVTLTISTVHAVRHTLTYRNRKTIRDEVSKKLEQVKILDFEDAKLERELNNLDHILANQPKEMKKAN